MAQGLTEYQLVLVGKDAYQSSQFRKEVSDLIISGRLILTGYIPDEHLSALYYAASVFVYPSLFEGFGLPILEAMACDTSVVTSNISSIPEVAGEAAMLVDPTSVGEIEKALHLILTTPELAHNLVVKGAARVKHFSWDKTARAVAQVYESVLRQHRNDSDGEGVQ